MGSWSPSASRPGLDSLGPRIPCSKEPNPIFRAEQVSSLGPFSSTENGGVNQEVAVYGVWTEFENLHVCE